MLACDAIILLHLFLSSSVLPGMVVAQHGTALEFRHTLKNNLIKKINCTKNHIVIIKNGLRHFPKITFLFFPLRQPCPHERQSHQHSPHPPHPHSHPHLCQGTLHTHLCTFLSTKAVFVFCFLLLSHWLLFSKLKVKPSHLFLPLLLLRVCGKDGSAYLVQFLCFHRGNHYISLVFPFYL